MIITSIKAGIINGTKTVNAVMQTLGRFVLFEFKHSELSTFQGGYLLNVSVPGVGFSVAGLDRAKFGFYRFQSFLFIVVIVISFLVKTAF